MDGSHSNCITAYDKRQSVAHPMGCNASMYMLYDIERFLYAIDLEEGVGGARCDDQTSAGSQR